jgi:hypothetical protein
MKRKVFSFDPPPKNYGETVYKTEEIKWNRNRNCGEGYGRGIQEN